VPTRSFFAALIVFVAVALPEFTRAQPPTPPTLAAAARRLQAQDAAGAATMLEIITKRDPSDAPAWRMLGVAYQRTNRLAAAMAAYQRSLAIEPTAAATLYGIGVLFAMQHNTAAAFMWLDKAKATHTWDMT
jgi:cytochrome c-type biogenesis protein CcmH/NrfG